MKSEFKERGFGLRLRFLESRAGRWIRDLGQDSAGGPGATCGQRRAGKEETQGWTEGLVVTGSQTRSWLRAGHSRSSSGCEAEVNNRLSLLDAIISEMSEAEN
ncbi:unnamed protein product [Pleuronectes platessa]|uniref:Uncharacterized protein n=1 Tax=Pleuronectes platessa TaxID=8262 RepID=A0A9N7VYA9_PLEPL|nr:unnamed protein product [Pleuronectes platessa]